MIVDTYKISCTQQGVFAWCLVQPYVLAADPTRSFFLSWADSYGAVDGTDNRHTAKAEFRADLNELLPIDPQVAESVFSLSVLEYFCELRVMRKEAFRILKERGSLTLRIRLKWSIHQGPHDYFCHPPYGSEYLLEGAGFVDIEIESHAVSFAKIVSRWNYDTRCYVAGPSPARILLTSLLRIFWHPGQKLAPLVDKLVRSWELEASGYFITARKP